VTRRLEEPQNRRSMHRFSRRNPQLMRWGLGFGKRPTCRHCKPRGIYSLWWKWRRHVAHSFSGQSNNSPELRPQSLYVRFSFAYTFTMFQGPSARKTFVVACKKCRRDVPTGVSEFPFQSIVVECPLCGDQRRYLPSEIFLGRVDQLVSRQMRTRAI
jgi:hypothetical protein